VGFVQFIEEVMGRAFSRRSALKAGAAAFLASQGALLEQLVVMPNRPSFAAPAFPDIQFDNGAFVHGPATFNDGAGNVVAQFGVTYALLAPARLTRNPTRADQATLANALATIEANFPASPSGVLITSVSYGLPYFARLPQSLVASRMPRLTSNTSRFVLEESPAFPTDVSPSNPGITKDRFNNTVVIERNDILFELRSDSVGNLVDVIAWVEGSNSLNGRAVASPNFNGLLSFGTPRLQFTQPGLPRKVADAAFNFISNQLYEFHTRINPNSSMTMGFVDQQANASAPPGDVIFASTGAGAGLTTAKAGDYFDNGAIAHFSHDIEDLYQFYSLQNQDSRHPDGEPFTERVMYMFRANQLNTAHGLPSPGNTDQFTNGGGPAFINNVFQGNDSVVHEAHANTTPFGPAPNNTRDNTFTGLPRIGHIAGLQRFGRTASGKPLHIRNDGPGFDSMDVGSFQLFPGGPQIGAGTNQFKLQFLVFVPTAEFFRAMRVGVAAQDLAQPTGKTDPDDNGLERFITATRRQNFLVPPRRHRSFPLLELT
jgi:hypothetical protein